MVTADYPETSAAPVPAIPPLPDIAIEADRLATELARYWHARTDPRGDRLGAMVEASRHLARMAEYVRRVREAAPSDG